MMTRYSCGHPVHRADQLITCCWAFHELLTVLVSPGPLRMAWQWKTCFRQELLDTQSGFKPRVSSASLVTVVFSAAISPLLGGTICE